MNFSHLLNQTMTPQRLQSTRDAAGGASQTWTNLGQAIPCRIEDASSDVVERFAMQSLTVTHRIFSRFTGLLAGDRISAEGRFFLAHAIQVRRAIGAMSEFTVIIAEEVRNANP
ncbi:phage head completion protein [Tuwongella immobilis]|uniref:Phage head-tail adaptor n=1 Tax=Tuwongella immobilis TaxID=692036 RepID=A0A6C2YQP8_9BACT|nr:hypothetical protein [Tuwongella immobilis]VIP03970.1 unnamed protein product [Tuwongella immobilis]VTS05307.1 unnamed protein product [Tuwongella immobilis]